MSTLNPSFTGPSEAVPQVAPAPSVLPRVRAPRPMFVAALATGLIADLLLDADRWGVSFPLVVVALLGALLVLGGREGWQRARPNAWLAVPLLVFSGFVAVRASPWLMALNVLASAVLLLLLTHFWAAGRVQRLGLGGYPLTVFFSAVNFLIYPPAVARDAVDLRGVRQHVPRLMPFVRGLLFALPVLAVFAVLLQSADVAFASAMDRVLSVPLGEMFESALTRTVGVGFCACVAAGVFGHALRRRGAREWGEAEAPPAKARLGIIEALMLVLSVDALFLVFAGFQVAYLFIGGATSPAPGYSYAEYARHGFFQLVWVSALTLALIMALARWTRRESRGAELAFRVGSTGTVALSLVILASAMKRMAFYEAAFGYTHLRLYTHVFMYALGAVLSWRAVTLWWRPERFAIGVFLTALGSVLAINLVNPDAFIARSNLELHVSSGVFDMEYLSELSTDAVPALVQGSTEMDPSRRAAMLAPFTQQLSGERSWTGWNLGDWQARRALDAAGSLQ
ncbi:MAG: DUF4153 domain-containing protein [Hyalangium sp.]|uniref:DUF4153 domain-containing protein n=1 Tax=Hyalangium sp. TaxID=2028555 RepID=UPI003899E607